MVSEAGTQDRIRQLLADGHTPTHVVDLGFAKSTVYKVWNEMRARVRDVVHISGMDGSRAFNIEVRSSAPIAGVQRAVMAALASMDADVEFVRCEWTVVHHAVVAAPINPPPETA